MENINRCENAARAYEERKRMRKLAGINENTGNIRPEIKDQIDQLVNNINALADGIRRRKTKYERSKRIGKETNK
jgi:hypothetical protein